MNANLGLKVAMSDAFGMDVLVIEKAMNDRPKRWTKSTYS
jgi:hypothetical protein